MDSRDEYNYIVRADFYPRGYIRPLGFTHYPSGDTMYIGSIDTHSVRASSEVFICRVNGSSWKYRLTYNYDRNDWKVERVGDSNE